MGGAVATAGNASPLAEANIHNDAAAAKIVFHAGWPLTMVGLDVTHQSIMTPDYMAQLKAAQTPFTEFISAITPFYMRFHQEVGQLEGFYVHDSSAIAYLIDPTLFETEHVYVDIAVNEQRNHGQTMADWRGLWDQSPNINVCLGVDSARFLTMYYERIIQ